MSKTVSQARIIVTVEVNTGATYGDEWNIGEMREQVKREALLLLKNRLKDSLISIVDEPRVSVVTMVEQKQ